MLYVINLSIHIGVSLAITYQSPTSIRNQLDEEIHFGEYGSTKIGLILKQSSMQSIHCDAYS